jgi:hypothetical protein
MLAVSRYAPEYIERCRDTFHATIAACGKGLSSTKGEPLVTRQLIVALDGWFAQRTRGMEGKDGNPMNEVRLLASSITNHAGVLTLEKGLRLTAEGSVLGLSPGDRISPSLHDLAHLVDAFLDAIERTYV